MSCPTPQSPRKQTLQQEDLQWLACPVCRQTLALGPETVRCTACNRSYPIADGIPVLLSGRAS
jgi:uncharacterized protein YbaR (Trm112 family)